MGKGLKGEMRGSWERDKDSCGRSCRIELWIEHCCKDDLNDLNDLYNGRAKPSRNFAIETRPPDSSSFDDEVSSGTEISKELQEQRENASSSREYCKRTPFCTITALRQTSYSILSSLHRSILLTS